MVAAADVVRPACGLDKDVRAMRADVRQAAQCAFGVPGQHALSIVDGFRLAELNFIASRTEVGAAFAAHGAATASGALDFYVETAADYGYYKVSFRVPGANVGVP